MAFYLSKNFHTTYFFSLQVLKTLEMELKVGEFFFNQFVITFQ